MGIETIIGPGKERKASTREPGDRPSASPEREGRNPANGQKIKIAASKRLSFSPAKAVKGGLEHLNRNTKFIAPRDLCRLPVFFLTIIFGPWIRMRELRWAAAEAIAGS